MEADAKFVKKKYLELKEGFKCDDFVELFKAPHNKI